MGNTASRACHLALGWIILIRQETFRDMIWGFFEEFARKIATGKACK